MLEMSASAVVHLIAEEGRATQRQSEGCRGPLSPILQESSKLIHTAGPFALFRIDIPSNHSIDVQDGVLLIEFSLQSAGIDALDDEIFELANGIERQFAQQLVIRKTLGKIK